MYPNKDVIGFGAYGNGGSSSNLSSLSPLAPPFTVDRSLSKINGSPLFDFNEPLFVTAPLNSSVQNWVPSHHSATRPSFFSNTNPEFDSIHSSNSYSYMDPESISQPCVNHAAEGVPNDCRPCIYPEGITTNILEAPPYYPSYVLPPNHDDSHSLIPKQHGYDLLSTSQVSTLKGSSHADYIQSSEYPMGCDSMWNGLGDWDHCKQVEIDGSIHSEEMNTVGPFVHQNHTNKGVYSDKDSRKFEDAPHTVNVLAKDEHTCQLDDNSFMGKNSKFMQVCNTRSSVLGAKTLLPEIHPQASSLKMCTNPRNYQIPYDSSCGFHLAQEDPSLRDVALYTNFSPASVIRLPAVGTSSSATIAGSTRNMNIGKDIDVDLLGHNVSPVTESSLSGVQARFDANQLRMHLDTKYHINTESSMKDEELSGNNRVSNDGGDHFLKEKFQVQVPLISRDGYCMVLGSNEAKSSPEYFTDNHYNPTVDSPCWKGASFPYFSSEVSGAVNPCTMQSLESPNDLNLLGAQVFSRISDGTSKVPFHIPGGNATYSKNELPEDVLPPHLEYPSAEYVLFGESKNNRFNETTKEWTPTNESINNSDSRTCENFQYHLEGSDFKSEKKGTPGICTAVTAMNDNDISEDGSSNVSSIDGWAKVHSSLGGALTPKLNVQALVNTMVNLSELLLFKCSSEKSELKEEDCEVLKNLINNLDTCILKKIEHKSLVQDPNSQPKGILQFRGEAAQHHKGLRMDRPKAAVCNVQGEINNQDIHAEKQSHIVSGKKDEKFSDLVSVRSDTSTVKDDKMIQAIKKVLSENFFEAEETQLQTLLYKNLWLEAEASLCSINYRDRFNRMKIEMENCMSKPEKETATNVETQSNCKISPYVTIAENLTPEPMVDPTKDILVQKSPVISRSDHADDVMARFHILKSRVGNPISMKTVDVSSSVLPDLNDTETVETEGKDSPIYNICSKDSPSSKTRNADNTEASVMARFHILKSRLDNSSSMEMKGQQLTDIDSGFSGKKHQFPFIIDEQENVQMEPTLQINSAGHIEDGLRIKEFHLHPKDYPLLPSAGAFLHVNQHPGVRNDSSPLDWEHVLKEELSD